MLLLPLLLALMFVAAEAALAAGMREPGSVRMEDADGSPASLAGLLAMKKFLISVRCVLLVRGGWW